MKLQERGSFFMKKTLTIGELSVAQGEKVSKVITVPGTNYELPITVINGSEDGKVFLATAGVHGCEYPGIQSLIELSQEIEPEEVSGAIIFILAVNPPAFYGRRAYVCPADEENKNFNHISPGNKNGTTADRVSAFIFDDIVPQCDFHVDMHSGDIVEDLEEFIAVCATTDPEMEKFCTEVAKHTCFTHRINSHGRRELYNSSAIDRGVPGLLFERGGQGLLNWDEVERDKDDIVSICQFLEILDGDPIDNSEGQIYYPRHYWGETGHTGCFYKFVTTGDEVKKGQKIGEIRDMFGELLEEIHAPFDGRVKISNNTLGVSKGDDTFMIGCTKETD